MFAFSISAGNAAPTILPGDCSAGAMQAGTANALFLDGRDGARRAGLCAAPALKRPAADLLDGISPTSASPRRAPPAKRAAPASSGTHVSTSAGSASPPGPDIRSLLPSELRDELLASDIDWAALRAHWGKDLRGLGSKAKELRDEYNGLLAPLLAIEQSPSADAADDLAQLRVDEQRLQRDMRKLRKRFMNFVQTRLFDNKTKLLVSVKNQELWQRFEFALEELLKNPACMAAEVALDVASDGMKEWKTCIQDSEERIQRWGPNGISGTFSARDTPDIAVIPKKAELVREAHEQETVRLRSAKYAMVKPLHKSTVGRGAFERGQPLLHARTKVTDVSTQTTWFEMMSLDRKRPNHRYINEFFRWVIRLQDNYRKQNTKEYSTSDIVLYQLLSLREEIDPAEIEMIELVAVDVDLIQWVGRHASTPKGIDVGDGIPWQDVPVDLFIEETEQGRLVRELAHALGKEVRQVWSFEYLPDAWGAPAGEGEPATVSADAVKLDVLAFIAPALY